MELVFGHTDERMNRMTDGQTVVIVEIVVQIAYFNRKKRYMGSPRTVFETAVKTVLK